MVEIQPSDATLGAVVRGVDLAALSDAEWKEIEAAFHTHAVLVFPEQPLSDEQQAAFSRRFGALERLITKRADNPEIGVLANLDREGRVVPAGSMLDLFLKGNTFWHTDSSYKAVPSKASLLQARVVPSQGGDTEFADMRAAWDTLDERTRELCRPLITEHSQLYSRGLLGFDRRCGLAGRVRQRRNGSPRRVCRVGAGRRCGRLHLGRFALRGR